ncbi:MFS transporter [Streptomyces sp. DT24]|uniref:MFS transporter n=1 Tax=unclassified Streptomyces TaxID=2593676 RepID=UPI0023B92754|nr:MFS transporter [Streptomyces sp. AM 4-1-1]WEH34274.1 MFS transporter [Streptomyces sp. AM 4-1-1]
MPTTHAGPRPHRFHLVAALLSATNFLAVFDGLVVTVALPAIQDELGISQLDAQWLITGYALPLAALLLFGGRCGDRYGRRRVLVTGLCLFTAGLLLAGLSPTVWLILVARVLQGVGAALAVPNSFATISAMPTPEQRNWTFSAVAVAGGLGAAGGAVIGGLITQGLGWRYVFLLTVPVAAATAVTATRVLSPGRSETRPDRLNGAATVLSVTGLMLLVFSITNIERKGPFSATTVGALSASLVLLAILCVRERRGSSRFVRPRLWKDREFRTAVIGTPSQVLAYDGMVFICLLYLQNARGYGPLTAGLAFSPLGLAVLLGSPVANRLLRAHHWTSVVLAAQVVCAVGLALLATAPREGAYAVFFLPSFALLGLGSTVSVVAFNVAAGKNVPSEDKGAAYGLYETSKYLSTTLVVAALATVAAARTGAEVDARAPSALATGYQLAFAIAAVGALAGGLLTKFSGRPGRSGRGGTTVPAKE